MRFLTFILVVFLVASLCGAAVVQRRIYRNAEEILVPVTVIHDGDEIPQVSEVKVKSTETEALVADIVKAVDEEQKQEEATEIVEQAQRRFDEAIVDEEIKEVIAEENNELLNAVAEEEKIENEIIQLELVEEKKEEQVKTLPEITPEVVVEPEVIKVVTQEEEPLQQLKSVVVVEQETPHQAVVVVQTADEEQPDNSERQATQATPSQTTTQQNFVQQFIQNSPLGQFFNQITGQNQPAQVANDEGAPASPAPTNPGFLNPVAAITNAAQSAVNSTQQALQQFASNIGNQFQNTLSSLTGQPQQQQLSGANDATTARPGPIQQLVNTFMGNNQQSAQPAPGQQQGPLQGLLSIFQGNNRPQVTAAPNILEPQPAKEPEIIEQTNDAPAEISVDTADDINNEVRDSGEAADSFEDTVQPEEMIIVNDDASRTHDNDAGDEQERANVPI